MKINRNIKGTKGFTLAELLIVVAIIAVLVAVAIPVFTAQLKKAQQAADLANARSIYAELTADFISNGKSTVKVYRDDVELSPGDSGLLAHEFYWHEGKYTVSLVDSNGNKSTFSFANPSWTYLLICVDYENGGAPAVSYQPNFNHEEHDENGNELGWYSFGPDYGI